MRGECSSDIIMTSCILTRYSLRQERDRAVRSFDELEEQFRPYRDHIDGLEGLNMLLKNQTSLAQSEVDKLTAQYTKLLGHQNQRQKIQHVKKLKDENAALKQVSKGIITTLHILCS